MIFCWIHNTVTISLSTEVWEQELWKGKLRPLELPN